MLKKSLRKCDLGTHDIDNTNVKTLKPRYTKLDAIFKKSKEKMMSPMSPANTSKPSAFANQVRPSRDKVTPLPRLSAPASAMFRTLASP